MGAVLMGMVTVGVELLVDVVKVGVFFEGCGKLLVCEPAAFCGALAA